MTTNSVSSIHCCQRPVILANNYLQLCLSETQMVTISEAGRGGNAVYKKAIQSNKKCYSNQFTVVKEPFILDCRQRSVYIGEKSCALPLVTSHMGEGGLTFLFQQFMWLSLNPLNQSDSLRFNKHRDIYNLYTYTVHSDSIDIYNLYTISSWNELAFFFCSYIYVYILNYKCTCMV